MIWFFFLPPPQERRKRYSACAFLFATQDVIEILLDYLLLFALWILMRISSKMLEHLPSLISSFRASISPWITNLCSWGVKVTIRLGAFIFIPPVCYLLGLYTEGILSANVQPSMQAIHTR